MKHQKPNGDAQIVSATKEEALAEPIEDVLDALDDPSQTPIERAKRLVRAVGNLNYPNEQTRAAARDQLRAFEKLVPDLVGNGDARILVREADALRRRCVELARPLPVTTPHLEIERCARGLVSVGFNGLEIDAVEAILKPNEGITGFNAHAITTDQRKIDRIELRRSCMPRAYAFGEAKWLEDNFPRIPTDEEEKQQSRIEEGGWRQ